MRNELSINDTLGLGIEAHKAGQVQEADRLYTAILQAQPKHPDANHNMGVLAVGIGKTQEALPFFKTALEASPNTAQFWLSYIDTLIKLDRLQDAKAVLDQAKNNGAKGDAFDMLEQRLNTTNTVPKAAVVSEPEVLKKKDPPEDRLQALINFYNQGKFQQTLDETSQLLEEFPKSVLVYNIQGAANAELGSLNAAIRSYEKALGIEPGFAEAYNNMGSVLKNQGKLDEAIEAYNKALSIKPGFAEAYNNMGLALEDQGQSKKAIVAYKKATAKKPDYAQAYFNVGTSLKNIKRFDEAIKAYNKAITIQPNYTEAHCNLGITLQEIGRLEEAEASYTQAITLKPSFAIAHSNLGTALQKLGRLEEAEASLRQAIALEPDYARAHSNLGATLNEMGKLDESEACFDQAIALKPDFTDARESRWILLFNKKDFGAALKDADFCITKSARELDLTTLYALGQIDEIYKRLEKQSKVDGENISIAAFAAFIAESEKKSTTYNFCPNPIDFIHFSNLSSHLKDSTAYISEVIEELDKVETIWEPSGKTTVSGFQSLNGVNLFKRPSGKIAQLKSIIVEELEAYYLKFQNESCSYIKKWPSGNNLFGWHVILKHQGHQGAHIHTSGWLSGVIYLKVVPSLGKDEGAIEFSLNGERYCDVNSPSLTFQPELGDIVFFPSSLHHRTIPFVTDTDRIIVSFDLIPKAAKH